MWTVEHYIIQSGYNTNCETRHGSAASHFGCLGSSLVQSTKDMRWTKWHWHRFLFEYLFTTVSIIPPLLHTHSFIYHPRCIMFFSQHFNLPCQYHSTIAPYSFIHLPPALYNVFLPALQFSPVSIIPPLLHTHPSIYHPRSIMFFSQHFSFPLSVSFHHCSILIHPSTTHAV